MRSMAEVHGYSVGDLDHNAHQTRQAMQEMIESFENEKNCLEEGLQKGLVQLEEAISEKSRLELRLADVEAEWENSEKESQERERFYPPPPLLTHRLLCRTAIRYRHLNGRHVPCHQDFKVSVQNRHVQVNQWKHNSHT